MILIKTFNQNFNNTPKELIYSEPLPVSQNSPKKPSLQWHSMEL